MRRKYIVMMRFGNSQTHNLDEQFHNKDDADKYVELMKKNKPDVEFYLFEQSKDYQHTGEKKKPTKLTFLDKVRLGVWQILFNVVLLKGNQGDLVALFCSQLRGVGNTSY